MPFSAMTFRDYMMWCLAMLRVFGLFAAPALVLRVLPLLYPSEAAVIGVQIVVLLLAGFLAGLMIISVVDDLLAFGLVPGTPIEVRRKLYIAGAKLARTSGPMPTHVVTYLLGIWAVLLGTQQGLWDLTALCAVVVLTLNLMRPHIDDVFIATRNNRAWLERAGFLPSAPRITLNDI